MYFKKIQACCMGLNNFKPIVINDEKEALKYANLINEDIVPLFFVSNVNGRGLDNLRLFVSNLPLVKSINDKNEKTEFLVIDKYLFDDKIILKGFLYKGTISKNKKLLIGPLNNNSFEYFKKRNSSQGNKKLQSFCNYSSSRTGLLNLDCSSQQNQYF